MTLIQQHAALYVRISTKDGRQDHSNQLDALRQFCERMKWVTSAETEYVDQDSGSKTRRPALDRLMRDATKRRFDVCVVFALDRLTRSGPAKAFEYIARLRALKVEFVSMTEEHFRTSGPAGDLFFAIAAYIAEQETSLLKQRIEAGIARARRGGTRIGRPKTIVNVERIRELRDAGLSLRTIAMKLGISKATADRRLREDV